MDFSKIKAEIRERIKYIFHRPKVIRTYEGDKAKEMSQTFVKGAPTDIETVKVYSNGRIEIGEDFTMMEHKEALTLYLLEMEKNEIEEEKQQMKDPMIT